MIGISFKSSMVLSLMRDLKTQTRRLMKIQPLFYKNRSTPKGAYIYKKVRYTNRKAFEAVAITDARYKVGVTYYVKEAIRKGETCIIYEADDTPVIGYPEEGTGLWRWKPDRLSGMYIPEWCARSFIRITAVRIQQVQEISEEDALAEGITWPDRDGKPYRPPIDTTGISKLRLAAERYEELWDSINGNDFRKAWNNNPWVIAYTFERVVFRNGKVEKAVTTLTGDGLI